jgi:hypothetical protein
MIIVHSSYMPTTALHLITCCALVGRQADGVDAMALIGDMLMITCCASCHRHKFKVSRRHDIYYVAVCQAVHLVWSACASVSKSFNM